MDSRASLIVFERLVVERNHDGALDEALRILRSIDLGNGRLAAINIGEKVTPENRRDVTGQFCTRFASAFGFLIRDPDFAFRATKYEELLLHHRWLDLIFAISGFQGSDHLVQGLANKKEKGGPGYGNKDFKSMLAVLSLNTSRPIDLDRCWQADRVTSGSAFLYYIASRYFFRPRAFEFREKLLEWLPEHLTQIKLGVLALSRIPEVYMHCSYAITEKKHAIKSVLMRQMRRACLAGGCKESEEILSRGADEKPTIVVIAENLRSGHSVYRTHAESVRALRKDFHLVGVVIPNTTDENIAEMFDEMLPTPRANFIGSVRQLTEEIAKRRPSLAYFLGVGMVPQVIALASLRLAPVQIVSFGHTASTMSPVMDYFVLPEDFVKARDRFSEKILALPKKAMPFQPRPPRKHIAVARRSDDDGVIRIAIASSVMKLNPPFFKVLARISENATNQVEFRFFPLLAVGLAHIELERAIKAQVPNSIVYEQAEFDLYLERLGACDFFLCPFPYGNMNSIVDAVSLGLPGVCLDGLEPHSHADAGIFARMGFPKELTAETIDEYVEAGVRLIDDGDWRKSCQRIAENCNLDDAFHRGDASLFAKAVKDLISTSVEA